MSLNYEQDVKPFAEIFVHTDDTGYIVWRLGTGNNVELLHIEVKQQNRGNGTALLKKMLERLLDNPPYCTVFGFTRVDNTDAQKFYQRRGFDTTLVRGVYADGLAVIFSAEYAKLVALHLDDPAIKEHSN